MPAQACVSRVNTVLSTLRSPDANFYGTVFFFSSKVHAYDDTIDTAM